MRTAVRGTLRGAGDDKGEEALRSGVHHQRKILPNWVSSFPFFAASMRGATAGVSCSAMLAATIAIMHMIIIGPHMSENGPATSLLSRPTALFSQLMKKMKNLSFLL